jgi:hypothetical protein
VTQPGRSTFACFFNGIILHAAGYYMYNKLMWYLVVEALNTPQKRLTLRPGIMRIGRASTNDVIVDDNAASRSHACIEYKPETNTLSVTDLQSTNGTYLNR